MDCDIPEGHFWKDYNDEQLSKLVDIIFSVYRQRGFPYYPRPTPSEIEDLLKKASQKSWLDLVEDKTIKQSMFGLSSAWSYFPHAWSVKCNKANTPHEVFTDDSLFKKAIRKRLKYGTYISDSGIRKALKLASGGQSVSNFRPSAAAAIYDFFGGGHVYDMSSGYGGRLLGAIISRSVKSYTGVDPCVATYEGLVSLAGDFKPNKKIELHNLGSEVFNPPEQMMDICFTSPHYFDTEKYSNEETQSYKKYPT